jgi:hypothetical protein
MNLREAMENKSADSRAGAPRITIGLAAFVLSCFFLPWVQVSCLGARDSASGLDLARGGERALWLIPLAMLLVLFVGLARFIWESRPAIFLFAGIVGGGLSAYLMFREHTGVARMAELLNALWTVWYWLGIVSSLGVAVSALRFYVQRSRAP